MIYLWNILIYQPIYNALIFIAQHITFQDVGLAVVVVTIIIRLALYPLSKKSIVGQYRMKALEPKLQAIKSQGLTKEAEAQATMALYKDEKINPFSGCLYLLIQLPILLALYSVFSHGISQPEHLYSFLSTENLKNLFLGLIDITKPFLPLAILAGVTQAIQAFLAPAPTAPSNGEKNMQNQLAQSLSVQTKYILPIIIIFIASRLAAAVSLYWTVANLFSILQELYLRRTVRSKMNQ
ncbi:MAG: 60 kDa inner rane insertion protein preprotein translocase subunit YidC [Candidatus Nomurabacteria bacterium]|nr:60 kDa inner rane insertion protein preprotein translocase subunit YidC [Candidatus Nomurabacteria bacterium]